MLRFYPFLCLACDRYPHPGNIPSSPSSLISDVHVRMRARFVISCQLSQEHLDVDQPRCLSPCGPYFVFGFFVFFLIWKSQGGTCEAVSSAHPTQIVGACVGMCHPISRFEQDL